MKKFTTLSLFDFLISLCCIGFFTIAPISNAQITFPPGIARTGIVWPVQSIEDPIFLAQFGTFVVFLNETTAALPIPFAVDLIDSEATKLATVEALLHVRNPYNTSILPPHTIIAWSSHVISPLPANLRMTTDYVSFCGSWDTQLTEIVGHMSTYYKVPHFNAAGTAAEFSDSALFPWTYNTLTSDTHIASSFLGYVATMKWKNFIYFADNEAAGANFGKLLAQNLPPGCIMESYYLDLNVSNEDDEAKLIDAILHSVKQTKIKMIYINHPETLAILRRAQKMSLAGADSGITWMGYVWCREVFNQVKGTADEILLLGSLCMEPHKPTESISWTNAPYAMHQMNPMLAVSLEIESKYIGLFNALQFTLVAFGALFNIFPLRSIKNPTQFRQTIASIPEYEGAFGPIKFDTIGNSLIDLDVVNYRTTIFGFAYLEKIGTLSLYGKTVYGLVEIFWIDGEAVVPEDRFYDFPEGTKIEGTISAGYFFLFLVSTIATIFASQIAAEAAIKIRFYYLQRARAIPLHTMVTKIVPWLFLGAFEAGVAGVTAFNLALTTSVDDGIKRRVCVTDMVLATIGSFVMSFVHLMLSVYLCSQEMMENALNEQVNRSETSVDFVSEAKASGSGSQNTTQMDKRSKRKRKLEKLKQMASRTVPERIANEIKEIYYENTTIGSLCASLAMSLSLTISAYLILASVVLPAETTYKPESIVVIFIGSWILIHYLVTKMIYYPQDKFWFLGYPVFYAMVSFSVYAINQQASISYEWSHEIEMEGVDTSDSITADNALLGSITCIAISAFVLIALLMERLQLSRNTLDVLLGNAQSSLRQMEDTLAEEKEAKLNFQRSLNQKKQLLELLITCRPLFREYSVAFSLAPEDGDIKTLKRAHRRQPSHPRKLQPTLSADPASKSCVNLDYQLSSRNTECNNEMFMSREKSSRLAVPEILIELPDVIAALPKSLQENFMDKSLFCSKNEVSVCRLLEDLQLNIDLSAPVLHTVVHSIQMEHILLHPVCFEMFKDYLNKSQNKGTERCIEIAVFWLDIQRFRGLTDATLRSKIAQGMYDTFLSPSATYSIPISLAIKNEVRHELQNGTNSNSVSATLFNSVQTAVTTHLRIAYEQFVTSSQFKICALILGHPAYAKGNILPVSIGSNAESLNSKYAFTDRGVRLSGRLKSSVGTAPEISSAGDSKQNQHPLGPDDPTDPSFMFTPRSGFKTVEVAVTAVTSARSQLPMLQEENPTVPDISEDSRDTYPSSSLQLETA